MLERCNSNRGNTLRILKQRRFEEIDVGRMFEIAEHCFGEGEMLHCLVYLTVARLVERSRLRKGRSANGRQLVSGL